MYCSYETRKVLDRLSEYGIGGINPFEVERDVGHYWQTHIIQIIDQVLSGGNATAKLAKVDEQGWSYFHKPVESLLGKRGAAQRSDSIQLTTEEPIYNAIVRGFCRTDFNMKELALLPDIASMIGEDMLALSNAFKAAGENRSIYYLHGIVRREYQTRQGRIREIQQKTEDSRGWQPDENFEKVDIVDRRELAADWQDRLNNLKINRALSEAQES